MKTAAKSLRDREARRRAYMREFRKDVTYYESHKRELLKQYRNKYIVIANQQVFDVDTDRVALLDRAFRAFGNDPFFYTEVLEKPRVYRVPTFAVSRKPAGA